MTITEAQIAALLETHQLGQLRSWRLLERASDDTLLLVNGDMLLRYNTGEPESLRLRKSAAIYRYLAQILPVPRVLALNTSHEILPYDLLLLERLEGRTALRCWPQLDRDSQERISYNLGQALAQVHSASGNGYGGFVEHIGWLGGSDNWRSYLLDKAASILLDLWRCEGLPTELLYGAENYLLRAPIPAHPVSALIHGDFGLHNVLLTRDGSEWRISGLCDFEWALAGDAEYEFATGLLVEPDEVNPLAAPFLQGYRSMKSLPEGWEQRSDSYRLVYHLALCASVYKQYNGDGSMLRYHRGTIIDILKR